MKWAFDEIEATSVKVGGVEVTPGGGGGVTAQEVTDAVNAAIAAHAGASDPHSSYARESDLGTAAAEDVGAFDAVGAAEAWVTAHAQAADPHPNYMTASEVTGAIAAHAAASDPHTAYALEANLAAIAQSGSASDLSAGTVSIARLPTGTSSSTVCLGSDARLSDARTPIAHNQAGETITTGTVAAARLPTFGSGAAGIVPQSGGGTSNFLRADGQWAAPSGGGSSPITTCRKSADQTFNSATPTNVTDLVFALTSGRYYEFRFTILGQSNTATVGLGISVTHAGATRFGATVRSIIAADGAGAELQGAVTASDDAVLQTAVVAINTDYVIEVIGVILASANGNLQLRARTETGTTNVIVRQGSVGVLTDFGT